MVVKTAKSTRHEQAKLAAKYYAYARLNGRNETARHFQLNSSMVGRWIKVSETWIKETNTG
uniref:Uncharacterized protein n=1 Tax=Rhizophagus irregularis (strain DAOM 181602 / DAOM 197198 / MUCL 43194) TaxID=747089 RepID=U9SYQ9_RHIID